MTESLWLAFQLDSGYETEEVVFSAIDAFESYVEKFSTEPTHISVHKDIDDSIVNALEQALPIVVCTSPPMAYETWFSIGVRDVVDKKLVVSSSAIADAQFSEYDEDSESGVLTLVFKNHKDDNGNVATATYEYHYVPKDLWLGFLGAESKGEFFAAQIKDKYVATKLEQETPVI